MKGKIFPKEIKIKDYKEVKNHFDKKYLIHKIGEAFNYKMPFSIETDFSPLFTDRTLNRSYFLYDKKILIGSILIKDKEILIKNSIIKVSCIGGVFICEDYQGSGLFKYFLSTILKKLQKSDSDFVMLWSEKEDLYKKFGFMPVGKTYWHYPGNSKNLPPKGYTLTSFRDLAENDFTQIKKIHREKLSANTFIRKNEDWEEIKKIHSINIFIKRDANQEVSDYYFQGKGMDLVGIIHEGPTTLLNQHSMLSPNKPNHQNFKEIPSALALKLKDTNKNLSEFFAFGADCI